MSFLTIRDVLAGTDFFTVEVLTWRGLVTYYVLCFIHLGSRRVTIAEITDHPTAVWMAQIGRNATLEQLGFLHSRRYLLHDRDTKFCESFREVRADRERLSAVFRAKRQLTGVQ